MFRLMLKITAIGCLALAGPTTAAGPAIGGQNRAPDYKKLSFEPISWPEPHVDTFTLDNGISFFLIKEDELPLIQMRVMVRSGGFRVPEDKTGLAEITGEVMRSGGTREYPPRKLNEILANRAAEMETAFGFISGSAELSVLSSDFQELLPVFVELLRHPAFPEDKIELARQRLQTRIARRNNEQSSIAMRTYKRLIYGPNSLYAREPEYETVKNIGRKDLERFHRRAYQGANLLVGVAGNFDEKTIRSELEKSFSAFPAGERIEMDLPDVKNSDGPSLYVVRKSDVNQSYILMGHLGGKRQNPDYAAWQVMNKILAGGFSSRLFEIIRTEMGLAYSVFGGYGSHYFYPGLFYAGLSTKTAATAKAVRAVKNELDRLQQGVSSEEVEEAKNRFFNSLVFRYDQAEEILSRRMIYAYRGMPADSFQELVKEIRQVEAQDVVRAAREYISPDALTILAVGEKEKLVDQLEKMGKVEVLPQP